MGDFAALLAAAIYAVYLNYSEELINERRSATSVYFSLLSIYTIILSYVFGQIIGEEFELFSVDPTTGFFGLFSTQYFLKLIVGVISNMLSWDLALCLDLLFIYSL